MIYAYGITLQGTYHIKNNIVCQDAHEIVRCSDDVVIAAVADGLGSEKHSDVASIIATKIATSFCKDHLSAASSADEILHVIEKSFTIAQQAIEQEAISKKHDLDQYDTTLSLSVLINDTLYYGHSGDSGIVALTTEGLYVAVTEQQRDADDYVYPLVFKNKWVFGQFDKKVCSVFLATDGMLETLFPFLIRKEPVNIHIALARYFMDNRMLKIDIIGEAAVKSRISEFIMNIPDMQVNDDKTIVVLVNPSVESELQTEGYYKEPDWTELQRKHEEEWKRTAYPHLFSDISMNTNIEQNAQNTSVDANKACEPSIVKKHNTTENKEDIS